MTHQKGSYTGYCKTCERAVQSPLIFCCPECERKCWRMMNFKGDGDEPTNNGNTTGREVCLS
jgi:hypothetical protein